MATYLQGVQPYIPNIQPFTPDLQLYSQVLQFKQGKQDAARDQLSTMYGSLLNSAMMREDNIAARDHFFKVIDHDIKKMAAMDLSKQQNLNAAMGVFTQLLDNKNIVRDMIWTKNWQNEMRKSEGFRNCIDPEKCGGSWWEGGEKYLKYKAQEFQNATAEEAMNFANVRYTPYQDVMKKALALAKEAGINVTIDQLQGGYITTTKNGPLAVGPLQNLFMGSLGSDPMIAEYYKTKAYVDRKDWVVTNAAQYGSEEAAETAYIAEMTPVVDKWFGRQETEIEDKINTSQNIKGKLEKKGNEEKVLEGDPLLDVYNEIDSQQLAYEASLGVVKDARNNINGIKQNQGNNKYTIEYIDNVMASMGLGQDIDAAAETLAYRDYEFKMKADEYSLEAVRQKNRMMLEEFKHRNNLELEEYKFNQEIYLKQLESMGGGEMNIGTPVDVDGGTVTGMSDEQSYEYLNKGYNQFASDREGTRIDLSGAERGIVNQVYSATKSAADNGDAQAQADFVNMVENMLSASGLEEEKWAHRGTGDAMQELRATEVKDDWTPASPNRMTPEGLGAIQQAYTERIGTRTAKEEANLALANKISNAGSLEEKYNLAKTFTPNMGEMSGTAIDDIYENVVSGAYDQTDPNNAVLREYLAPIWDGTTDARRAIMAKRHVLDSYDAAYAAEAQEVIQKAMQSGDYTEFQIDAFKSYINAEGHAVSKAEFIQNMTNLGHSSVDAENFFRGDQRKSWNDPDKWFDGTANVAKSVVDGVGTILYGAGDFAIDVISTAFGNGWIWGDGRDWGTTPGGYGWDYDSPNDVANWGAPGGDEHMKADDLRFADAGIHDLWKRAFSAHVSPNGDLAWLGINGAGDKAVMGVQYQVADPAAYRSVATTGTIGFMKDFMAAPSAVVSLGKPTEYMPEIEPEEQQTYKEMVNIIMRDMITMKKGESRPLPQVTYQDVATQSDDMTALNIVLNQAYVNKYKGSKETPGPMRDYMDQLVTEGLTMYLPKQNATNAFRLGSNKNHLEKLMGWSGELTFNDHGQYAKDFKITSDPITGNYTSSGLIMAGLNEDGTPNYQAMSAVHPNNTELTSMVNYYDNFLAEIKRDNIEIQREYKLRNGYSLNELANQ